MTEAQRGFLWGEVYPAIAYGIDRLLDEDGQQLALLTSEDVHKLAKRSLGVKSTEMLSKSEVADYITELQAFAASCLIFVATPEEYFLKLAEERRAAHYWQMFEREERQAA